MHTCSLLPPLRFHMLFTVFCTSPQVRAIKDGRGSNITQAGPGQAVVVSGLRAIPAAGDELIVVGSESRASKMAAARSARAEDFRQGQLARMQAEHSRRQQQLRKQEYERWVCFCRHNSHSNSIVSCRVCQHQVTKPLQPGVHVCTPSKCCVSHARSLPVKYQPRWPVLLA
jgi:hypothetical protein